MNILIIDDAECITNTAQLLQLKGHTITINKNLADAEESLATHGTEYELILLDLGMDATYLPPNLFKYAIKNRMFPGWIFYKYIILNEFNFLADCVVFFTGYKWHFSDWLKKNDYAMYQKVVLSNPNRIIDKSDINTKNELTRVIGYMILA